MAKKADITKSFDYEKASEQKWYITKSSKNDVCIIDNNSISGKVKPSLLVKYTFSTNPKVDDIKKTASKISEISGYDSIIRCFGNTIIKQEKPVDLAQQEIERILSAITVLSFKDLATPSNNKKAKSYLETVKRFPADLFSDEIDNYIEWKNDDVCISADLVGFYTDWDKDITSLQIWNSAEAESAGFCFYDDEISKTGRITIFAPDGWDVIVKLITESEDFNKAYNKLLYFSALAIIIRGGFTNLLESALSANIPISDFYDEICSFAKEIGSNHCYEVLIAEKSNVLSEKPSNSSTKKRKPDIAASDDSYDEGTDLITHAENDEGVAVSEGIKENGKIAKNNEKAIVNRDFSIQIPAGYTYSTDTSEIHENRVLVFIKTERNDYFNKKTGDFDMFSLENPFAAPRCLTVVPNKDFGSAIDLSNIATREAMQGAFGHISAFFGGTCTVLRETKNILIYYSKFKGKDTNTTFMIVTPQYMYTGQIWLNDVKTLAERNEIAVEWLNNIKHYVIKDSDKISSKPFEPPTYREGKREQMGTVTVAVPDQMKTISSESDSPTFDIAAIDNLKEEFAFLAVNKDFSGGFSLYKDADFIIKAANDSIRTIDGLSGLWGDENKAKRKNLLTQLIKSSIPENTYDYHYKDLGEELAAVYTQVGESSDKIEQWANFFVALFYKESFVQVNIHIKAQLNNTAMDKAIAEWVSSVKPANEEEIKNYNNLQTKRVLGQLAGKDGRIDGVKATQLFFEDVFFFVKGQITSNGSHHTLHGLQINAAVLDNFPQIKNNPRIFGTALTELINYVEEDEMLVLNEEAVHYEFDKFNKIDSPIIEGKKVEVKDAKIGKGLSGIRAFLLIAWHMLKIVESEENKYIVALDQNMYRGIPDAQAYICQLIKRLREYNGIKSGFEVMFASTFNLVSVIDGQISGNNPLAIPPMGFEPVCVKADENPYEKVQKQISESKNDGVWAEWQRGKSEKGRDSFDREIEKYNKYEKAKNALEAAKTSDEMRRVKKKFSSLKGYLDSAELAAACDAKIEEFIAKEDEEERKKQERIAAEKIAKLTPIYNSAVKIMNEASDEKGYKAAANKFKTIPGFKDADSLVEQCLEEAEVCRKDTTYASACSQMTGNTIGGYETAINLFRSIPGWKDADEQICTCRRKIEEIREKYKALAKAAAARKAENERIAAEKAKKRKRTVILCSIATVFVIIAAVILATVVIPNNYYSKAADFEASGNYESAIIYYRKAGSYKDSHNKLRAVSVLNAKNYTVNDTVYLGEYNGKVLEWIVVSVDGNQAVLVCNSIVANKEYNDTSGGMDTSEKSFHYNEWPKCSLRTWLNTDFLDTAFNDNEMSSLTKAKVESAGEDKDEGSVTDYVYIMSEYEMENAEKTAWDADYSIRKQALWLRGSSGTNGMYAEGYNTGSSYGLNSLTDLYGVVPVIWLTIK